MVLFGKAVVRALLNHIAGVKLPAIVAALQPATYTSRATGHLVRNDAFALDNMKPASAKATSMKSVLPNPTAEDLKHLGIATIGHPRKLLDAISAGP